MRKVNLIIAILGIATLTHATSINCNFANDGGNSYGCNLSPQSFDGYVSGDQFLTCTVDIGKAYDFDTCNLIVGGKDVCTINVNSQGECNLLPDIQYILSGCKFEIECQGKSQSPGSCTITYKCSPSGNNGSPVPDVASTASMMAGSLLLGFFFRRQIVSAQR